MCAQFMIKAELSKLARRLKAQYSDSLPQPAERILPYSLAPVVVQEKGERVLKLMSFSLVPSWSLERKAKFATHNARLSTVDERTGQVVPIHQKPTWKRPFSAQRCIVPMTGFIEPIYNGQWAGNMVHFHSAQGDLFFAAGIYDVWTSKTDGEIVESFAVLTDDPIPFVKSIGHERSPVFIFETAVDAWLAPGEQAPERLLEILRTSKDSLSLTVESDRPLAKGWEKRR